MHGFGHVRKFFHILLMIELVIRHHLFIELQMADEVRHVYQMQYLAWPDHGVPDDSSDFLDFVAQVRQNRAGVVEPTIVHCRFAFAYIAVENRPSLIMARTMKVKMMM